LSKSFEERWEEMKRRNRESSKRLRKVLEERWARMTPEEREKERIADEYVKEQSEKRRKEFEEFWSKLSEKEKKLHEKVMNFLYACRQAEFIHVFETEQEFLEYSEQEDKKCVKKFKKLMKEIKKVENVKKVLQEEDYQELKWREKLYEKEGHILLWWSVIIAKETPRAKKTD